MSVVSEEGSKVILPRVGPEEFWDLVREHYACEDPQRWKALAILALRENAGWPLETIGHVFGHHRGHVSRILAKVKRDLRSQFERSPDWLGLDEEGFSDPDQPGESVKTGADRIIPQ